jgi:hypothetical protein
LYSYEVDRIEVYRCDTDLEENLVEEA